jgi:hypothetical protein
VARNLKRLPRFIDLFDESETLRLKLGDRNTLHDHYFIYSQ